MRLHSLDFLFVAKVRAEEGSRALQRALGKNCTAKLGEVLVRLSRPAAAYSLLFLYTLSSRYRGRVPARRSDLKNEVKHRAQCTRYWGVLGSKLR